VGWSPIYENQQRQWNLRLADNLLIKDFIKEIRTLRKIQKIRPEHPLKGKKHRGVSWRPIELLDRKQNDIGKFNASQRHTLNVAGCRAEQYFVEYKRALTKWRKHNPAWPHDFETLPDSDGTIQSYGIAKARFRQDGGLCGIDAGRTLFHLVAFCAGWDNYLDGMSRKIRKQRWSKRFDSARLTTL
jgi:hypothetical protein